MKIYNNCIVLVCNEAFLPHALYLAHKVSRLKKNNYDVIICSGEDLSDKIPKEINFVHIDTEEFTENLPTIPRLQQFTYWRIPAINALTNHYSKILYLDVDIFVDCFDISDIFHIDLKNHIIGAVRDVHQIVRPTRTPREFKGLGLDGGSYFNAGLLLINSNLWRENNAYEKIISISKIHRERLYCHDQSLLNLLVKGQWIELSPVWNWQYSKRNSFITHLVAPKLIHFSGHSKFWNYSDEQIPTRFRENHHNFFNDSTPVDFPLSKINKKTYVGLLKNIWYLRKYHAYVSRFKTHLSVVAH